MAFPAPSLKTLSADLIKVSPTGELSQGLQVQSPIIQSQSKSLSSSTASSLVFVDSGVIDASSLLTHSAPGTEVVYLNAIEDAVTQITRTLLNYSGISSVHILSHGTSGGLTFAQGSLTAENLGQYTNQIKSWSQALSTDADILLYGCDVAGGVAGAAFIRQLGQLSQADIAASTNITGAGGDWILEATTGTIESALISDATGRSQYRYSLDSPVQLLSNSNGLLASSAAGGDLGDRSVSANGNFVVFSSAASTLVAGDTNGKKDVFLYDRSNNTVTLISHANNLVGQPSNGDSTSASISADGNFVIFNSTGNNLTADSKTGGANDLFRWNRSNGAIDLISKVGTATGNGNTVNAVISGDGSTIAFISTATNLTGAIADTNNSADIFLWTATAGQVTLIDKNNDGTIGELGVGDNLDISSNGRFIAFNSRSQMSDSDRNLSLNDIYVYDGTAQTLELISGNGIGANSATTSVAPRVRYDETTKILRVLFSSEDRLAANDASFSEDIYVAEKNFTDPNNTYAPLRLVSRTAGLANGTGTANGNNSSSGAVFSGNGRYVAFTSKASDLVAGDTNGVQDVFLHDLNATDPSTATRLISRNSSGGTLGNGDSKNIAINDDGSIVAFTSTATNLVNGNIANDLNGQGEDIFAYDRNADSLTLVTRKTGAAVSATLPSGGGALGGRSLSRPVVANTSKTIIYANDAIDLVAGDSNDKTDIFAFDLTTSANTLLTKVQISQNSSTGAGNSTLQSAGSVSRDGRYAVFTSVVNSLVANDGNAAADIFIRDTTLAITNPNALKLVSRTVAGASGNQLSSQPFISADGKYVVFTSAASDLVTTDTNTQQDVFLYDVSAGTVSLVSKTSTAQGDGASGSASVAVDAGGEVYVTFLSRSGNFGASGTGVNNVFVWKKSTGTIAVVSKSSGAAGGNLDSSTPIISADGKYIAFTSNSTNLTTTNFAGTDTNGAADVFIYDITAATLKLVSQNSGTIGNNASFNPVISDTNGVVAFESRASNLTAIVDSNGVSDIFRYNGTSNSLISVNAAGNAAGDKLSTGASISADGNTIAFTSEATNLSDTTDSNAKTDVFVRTLTGTTPKTTLISRSRLSNTASNGQSDSAALSADGQFVAFLSTSTDLSTQDSSPTKDVFTSSITTPNAKLVSASTTGNPNGDSSALGLSRDGGVVVFESNTSNLIALDDNNASDIFSRPTRPTVSFKVLDPTASEGITDTGTYEISRTDISGSLDVKLKLSNLLPLTDATIDDVTFTADLGATVTVAAGIITVKIPDGVAKVTLTLSAIVDLLTEGSENAILNLQADGAYSLDPINTTGTVVIAPSGTLVTNTLDSGVGSLRQAIANARLTAGSDIITFALTNPALKTITLLTALDDLNGNITIDGGTSGVILSGTSTTAGTNGLSITGSGNVVKGITVTGFTGNGILIDGSNNTVGGTIAGSGNTVNGNKLGVYVKSGTGNQILGNAITNNTDLGIDVNPIGPITTDPLTLTTAVGTTTGATITGTLTGAPGTYRIEFFSNATTDTVGRTEGEVYLGFQDVTIAAGATTGGVSYSSTAAGLANKYISATVTDQAKNTSEFVKDIRVITPLPTVGITSAEDITGLAEGNTGTTAYKFNLKLSAPVTTNTTFNYRTVAVAGPTGAIAGIDYTAVTTGTVTVLAGSDTAIITIDVKGDTRFELDKSFQVELFGINTALYAPGTVKATGIIKNDDLRPTISFESNAVSIAEGQTAPNPQLPFKINLSNASDEAITVTYETIDGPIGATGATSTGANKDFTAVSPTVLTFAPGEVSKTVNVEIIADTIDESPETFSLSLTAPTNATFATGPSLAAIGTILPDEQPYVFSVVAANLTILEGATGANNIAKFTVTLDRDPQEDLIINYATNSGLAVSGTDFVGNTGILTFLKGGGRSQTIDVTIIGNNTFQGDRDFELLLLEPSARVSIDPTKASATTLIKEDDLPTLSFKVGNSGDVRGVEGSLGNNGSVSVVVELSQVSNQNVTVEFTTLDGTATVSNNDYTPRTTPGQKITILAGQKNASVNFELIGDNVIEPDETFFVKLSNPIGATILGSDTQTVIIEDDDARIANQPQISINAINATQTEGNTGTKDFTFAVTLNKAPEAGKPVSVTVATTDGIGNNGATVSDNDYIAKTQVITFNPGGPLTQQFTVKVNGDTKLENTETFGIVLTNAVNGILGTQNAIATITDDDTPVGIKPVVSIAPITLTQNEGNAGTTPFTFRVTLDKAPAVGETVSVDVATIDGTAISGGGMAGSADFTAKTQTFTFTSTGALTQDFTVLVNGDTQIEANEGFTVELRNATGATLSSNALATATIKDDDTPIVTQPRISVSPITLAQNEGNTGTTPMTFRVTLDKAPEAGSQVSVEVRTVDGVGSTGAVSTGSNADFVAKTQTFTFISTGALTQDFTVLVNGDTQLESNETFTVELRNAIGGVLTTTQLVATINNDDGTSPGTRTNISTDSLNDILWRNPVTGETLLWQTNLGPTTLANTIPNTYDPATWRYGGTADFNKDGSPDFLWHNIQTGEVIIWKVNGNRIEAFINTTINVLGSTFSVPGDWHIEDISDYTRDSKPDILWRNYRTNQIVVWEMDGFNFTGSSIYISQPISLDWNIEAIADFTGAGSKSLFWRNRQTGDTVLWKIEGYQWINGNWNGGINLRSKVEDRNWQIVTTGDMNGDRTSDVLWQNTATGEAFVWYMGSNGLIQGTFLPKPTSGFQIKATGDFNQDGTGDLYLQNRLTGQNQIWYLQQTTAGIAYGSTVLLPNTLPGNQFLGTGINLSTNIPTLIWRNTLNREIITWQISPSPADASTSISALSDPNVQILWTGDLDGTGRSKVLTRNRQNGIVEIGNLNNGIYNKVSNLLPIDGSWTYRGMGDVNGDGVKDIFWQNSGTGKVEIWKLGGDGSAPVFAPQVIPGAEWVINQVADFNADGLADIFWRNSRTNQTVIWIMDGATIKESAYLATVSVDWQITNVADFDRNGTADFLWRNTVTGQVVTWLLDGKSIKKAAFLPTMTDLSWNVKSVADYDRDGNPDILWYNSRTKQSVFWKMKDGQYGSSVLLPEVPNSAWDLVGTRDFNGDGNLDLLWLNTATGTPTIWYLNNMKYAAVVTLPNLPNPNFKVIGLDDFNQIPA